jgi:hypothetical protein
MVTGKTKKYFKYAIGEIILVVIGILIAVQINAWVNSTKLQNDNEVFLRKMLTELELNKTRMNMLISNDPTPDNPYIGYEQAVKNCNSLLKMTYRGLTYADTTFIFNNRTGAGGSYLNLHTSIYDELINTGRLYTIGSDELTTAIKDYYKRCEREDLYNRGNTAEMDTGFNLIDNTLSRISMDRGMNSANFNIKDYEWFTDMKSKDYQNLQIAIAKIGGSQNRNMVKAKQLIHYSDTLINTIKKELKNTYD